MWEEAESELTQVVGDNPEISSTVLGDNLKYLFDEGFLEKNNINPLKEGLKQAAEERNEDPRKAQRWIADIEKKNNGTKKKDLILVVEKTVDRLQESPNSEGRI